MPERVVQHPAACTLTAVKISYAVIRSDPWSYFSYVPDFVQGKLRTGDLFDKKKFLLMKKNPEEANPRYVAYVHISGMLLKTG